ncbi:MAG TPA: BTAD domain-containing putative transcriptional regulator [Gemmatimonadales bacterium]|jgi:serine/threonine-protein kinase
MHSGGASFLPSPPSVELWLLGAPSVRSPAGPEATGVLAQPKRLALLAYLAAAFPYGFHRRDTLLALFWPEADQGHARTALRKALHFLRHELGPSSILSRGDEEIGLADTGVWCDVREYERALEEGRPAEGLALYRGDLLPGLFISDAPEFERWLADVRARLRTRAVEAAWSLAGRLERDGDVDDAARWARWACAQAPDDECAARRLIALLGRMGDRAGAVHAYDEFAARLRREYEVEPSTETQRLLSAVREGRVQGARIGPSQGVASLPSVAHGRKSIENLRLSIDRPSWQYLAVFPFTVHGDESAGYLHEGLVDLLSTNLDHAGSLHSIDPHALMSLVAREGERRLDPARAGELAQRLGARFYLLGSVTGMAGRLRIDVGLHDQTSSTTTARYLSVAGQVGQLFEMVDDLTAKLLAELHPGHGARLARMATATTDSLPALKAYLAGEKALRAGRYIEAVDAFQQAVAEDPEFALAWYRLAFFLSWPTLPKPSMTPDTAERALHHKDRLPERERLLLEALTASLEGAGSKSERLYRQILALHPEDVEAWIGLGQTLTFHNQQRGRLLTESRTAFERALALDRDNATATLFLSYVAFLEGDFDEGNRLIARAPKESDFVHPRIVQAFSAGDRASQDQAITFLRTAPDVAVYEAARYIATLTFDLAGARQVIELLRDPMRPEEVRGFADIVTAFLDLAAGRWVAARQHLTRALPLQPAATVEYRGLLATLSFLPVERADLEDLRSTLKAWDATTVPPGAHPYPGFDVHQGAHSVLRLYLLGALSARLGDAGALSCATELDRFEDGGDAERLARDLAHSVRAQHAFWRGEPRVALAALELLRLEPRQILSVLQSPFYTGTAERWLRAELLHELGRDEEALRWYRSLAQSSLYDLIYLAPSHLRRGEICEALGDTDQATQHYRRAVELWSGCDPELRSMLARAITGLERLGGADLMPKAADRARTG